MDKAKSISTFRKPTIILLVFLLSFHFISNIVWIKLDTTPLQFDSSTHTLFSIQIWDCLKHITTNTNFSDCIRFTSFYPPGMYVITGPLFDIFGASFDISRIIGNFYFVGLLFAVFFWSNSFFKDSRVALLATTLTSFSPGMYELSRALWQEVLLLLAIFITMFFLLKSDGFRVKKYTVLAFLTLGTAVYIKWGAVIYLLVPFLFEYASWVKRRGFLIPTVICTLLSLISLTPFILWVYYTGDSFFYFAKFWAKAEPAEPQFFWSFANFLYYPDYLLNRVFGFPLIVATLISFTYFIRTTEIKPKLYILFNIAIPYLFFLYLGNKDPRYILFFIPIFTGLISYLILNVVKRMKISYVLFSILLAYQTLQYFVFSFEIPTFVNFKHNIRLGKSEISLINLSKGALDAYLRYDSQSRWPVEEIVDDVSKLANGTDTKLQVIVEYPKVNNQNIRLQTIMTKNNNIIVNDDLPFGHVDGFLNETEVLNYVRSKDYFLVSSHEPSTQTYTFKKTNDQIQEVFTNNRNNGLFELIKVYKIPYEEINKLLYAENSPKTAGPRYYECQKVKCDELYLYKVVESEKAYYNLIERIEYSPPACDQKLCPMKFTLKPTEMILIKGTYLKYQQEEMSKDSSKGETNIWTFSNAGGKDITLEILGWPQSNSVEKYTINGENRTELSRKLDLLIHTVTENLSQPGNCNEDGCTKVSYIVRECTDSNCIIMKELSKN